MINLGVQPGDLVWGSGTGFISRMIEYGTGFWFKHNRDISHAAIATGKLLISESEYKSTRPDIYTGKSQSGVGCHYLTDRIQDYANSGGKMWLSKLTKPLTQREIDLLIIYCCKCSMEGVPYDFIGACRSARYTRWKLQWGKPNPKTVFCSEHVCFALCHIGREHFLNPSGENPNSLYHALLDAGHIQPREQLLLV